MNRRRPRSPRARRAATPPAPGGRSRDGAPPIERCNDHRHCPMFCSARVPPAKCEIPQAGLGPVAGRGIRAVATPPPTRRRSRLRTVGLQVRNAPGGPAGRPRPQHEMTAAPPSSMHAHHERVRGALARVHADNQRTGGAESSASASVNGPALIAVQDEAFAWDDHWEAFG